MPERAEVDPPVRPAAMDGDDVAGAEAAARYFIELYPYVYATGDLAEWEAMSHPECIFCANVVADVEQLRRSGGYREGGAITVREAVAHDPVQGNNFFSVDMLISEAASVERAPDVAEKSATGGEKLVIAALAPTEASWTIRAVQVEDADERA